MKILVHSDKGDGVGLALRFKEEGHKVYLYIDDPSCRKICEGMMDHVKTVAEGVAKNPDFVLFDVSKSGKLADRLKKAGVSVVGGSEISDKMEFDRKFGIDLARQYGIKVPESSEFKNIEEAIKHVKTKPKAYAIKMSGGESGCASSYVAKGAEDMLEYIEWQKERKLIKTGMEFVLQEVVKGVEISTEIWFSEGKPILPYNSTFENKKLMPGDLGPATGCETSAVFPYLSSSPKMVEKTLLKIFPFVLQMKYTGPLDINCIVSEKDHEPYFLEWTPRLGYSAIYALAAMIEKDIGEFFGNVSRGTIQRIPLRHSWGMSLKASVFPYPFDKPNDPKLEEALFRELDEMPIKTESSNHLWPMDVKKGKRVDLVCAGTDGAIAECTGVGEDLKDAWLGSCKVFESIQFPNKMGRLVDGSLSAFKRANQLRDWGYDVPDPLPRKRTMEIPR